MYRHILKIGNARYHFNRSALDAFVKEAKDRARTELRAVAGTVEETVVFDAGYEEKLRSNFDDVMALYRTYLATESVDALVRLKKRLEEVSIAYRSHVLAEEVLAINSCLPYERRVQCLGQ